MKEFLLVFIAFMTSEIFVIIIRKIPKINFDDINYFKRNRLLYYFLRWFLITGFLISISFMIILIHVIYVLLYLNLKSYINNLRIHLIYISIAIIPVIILLIEYGFKKIVSLFIKTDDRKNEFKDDEGFLFNINDVEKNNNNDNKNILVLGTPGEGKMRSYSDLYDNDKEFFDGIN